MVRKTTVRKSDFRKGSFQVGKQAELICNLHLLVLGKNLPCQLAFSPGVSCTPLPFLV